MTEAKRSGLWSMQAEVSRPPLEPPMMASFSGLVNLFCIRNSAAAIKSSKTFCFLSSIPALCHSSPYSAPPRILASA